MSSLIIMKIRFVCFEMMWVGHVLDHVPGHVLDHMIIGLVTTALQLHLGPLRLQRADSENNTESREHFQTQIQSKQYNQQHGQSNTIKAMQSNDTARGIQTAIWLKRSKRYDL